MLAIIGGLTAGITWVLLAALTGLGKLGDLAGPLLPIAVLAGAALAISRLRSALWVGATLVTLFSACVAFTPLTTAILPIRSLVRGDTAAAVPLDAVVVLSGGVTADSLLVPEVLDRLLAGLALMRDSIAPRLIVTRARRTGARQTTADQDQQRLRSLLSRPFPLIVIDSVRTTRDEAVNSWRELRALGVAAPRIAVVTSPLHTRRACATFEQVGFAVQCVPATSRAYSVERASSPEMRIDLFRRWLYERAAWTLYRSRGWVRG
jgi:uncharacterized SAM-binding protein YcdF (DUF218 family)